MLDKEKIKKYLKKAVDEKYDEKTIFRYTSIINTDINNNSFNFKNEKSFYLSYPNIKYYGLDNCIKYELKSKGDILNLINKKTKVISFGDNTKKELKFFGSIGFDMDVEFEYPSENIPKGLFFVPKILIEKNKKNTIISFHTLLNKDINSILKEISTYMKDHGKSENTSLPNTGLILDYQDTDTFHIIAIKEDLAVLTDDCKELLEKAPEDPHFLHLHKETNKNYINQLQELRQYSVQIESALEEYEKNILKIEEEISNETLCN